MIDYTNRNRALELAVDNAGVAEDGHVTVERATEYLNFLAPENTQRPDDDGKP